MVIALLLMLLMPAVQQDPPKAPKPPKRGDVVVARGCLRGGMLESVDLSAPGGVDRFTEVITFRLTGDKKAIQALKRDHDGHSDVITGELRTDLPSSTEARGKKIGNTRITIGAGASRGMNAEPMPPPMPVLKVTSVEHTGATCR